eukprot:scaffold310573_cov32-Tisochrysis_lutea.AAC.1
MSCTAGAHVELCALDASSSGVVSVCSTAAKFLRFERTSSRLALRSSIFVSARRVRASSALRPPLSVRRAEWSRMSALDVDGQVSGLGRESVEIQIAAAARALGGRERRQAVRELVTSTRLLGKGKGKEKSIS